MVHIYYTRKGATAREGCLCRSGLTRQLSDFGSAVALPQPYKHIIHPFRDFVKGFFEKNSKKLKVKTRLNPEKRAAAQARGAPKLNLGLIFRIP